VRLDHLSYAVAPGELVDTVQRIGGDLGVALVDGGRHPRFGTRNFVLPLAGGIYVEVVTTLDHPATEGSAFRQAVLERVESGGGWLGWVVAVDDIAAIEARIGRESVEGHRVRPDGFDLRWRQIGVNGLRSDPQLPFFTQWLTDPSEHPSRGANPAVGITRIDIVGDPAVVSDWLGQDAAVPLGDIDMAWISEAEADREPGIASATFRTPHGDVVID